MGPYHAVLESTELEWDRCIQVALMGTHYFTRETLPYMVAQKKGSIVNIVSIQAMVGCMTSVSYTATKAALLGYTLSAAYDYGPHNIRVNSLCPGPIQTFCISSRVPVNLTMIGSGGANYAGARWLS